jgi:PPM family protein phosphatase
VLTAVLADGMGGHAGGALASGLACKFFLHAFATSSGDVAARLAEALDLANAAIAHETAENPGLNGMGCTLIGVAFGPRGVEWVSVGDSPLFLVRKGEIVLLNEDHSLAPEIDKLAEAGKITWAAARADPRRHFLRSALTGTEIDLVDRSHRPLALHPGDVVILASDGIHSISHEDIARVVAANPEPKAAAEALLAAVEAVGDRHQDNTTVVVVRVTDA